MSGMVGGPSLPPPSLPHLSGLRDEGVTVTIPQPGGPPLTCVPQATRVMSLPSIRTSACESGMV